MIEKIVLGKFRSDEEIEAEETSILKQKKEKLIFVKNRDQEEIRFIDANEQIDLQKDENNLQK